jgi:hypothetical protein
MAGPKKITRRTLIGQQGINLIEKRVLELGWIWNPATLDAGIDGVIEIRDPRTEEATNLLLQVQSKATGDRWTREDENSFEFLCDERDIDYWMRGNAPVLLVCSRPKTDEAYWAVVKEQFADPQRRKSRVARFDKKLNRLNSSGRERLLDLAMPSDAGVYLSPVPRPETLITNLLPIKRLPGKLWLAPTEFRVPRDLWGKLRELEKRPSGEWVLREKRILTVHELDEHPWREVCDVGGAESFDAAEWFESEDRDQYNDCVNLLRRCLRELLADLRIDFDRKSHVHYFRVRQNRKPRKVSFRNRRQMSERTVVKPYAKKDGTTAYHRHAGFSAEFRRFDGRWYLEVVPTYHFTRDGREPYAWYEERLKGIKRLEKNEQVESQLRLIAWLLTAEDRDRERLFPSGPYPFLAFDPPLEFELPVGVPDEAWLPSRTAEVEDEDPLPLFDWGAG